MEQRTHEEFLCNAFDLVTNVGSKIATDGDRISNLRVIRDYIADYYDDEVPSDVEDCMTTMSLKVYSALSYEQTKGDS